MAVVITVAQRKGGAGKTMLAANLAAALSERKRVALLDIDPQQSLTRWHANRTQGDERVGKNGLAALSFTASAGWRVSGQLERLRAGHDVVVVDTPPQIDTEARLAVRGADLVLVPLQPSLPDLWAAETTLGLAAAERRRARLVLNRAPATSRLRAQVEAEIAERGLPLLAASLGNRTSFATTFARGMGATEAARHSLAAAEIRRLLAAIEADLG
jgi:chromosome partitioning protein